MKKNRLFFMFAALFVASAVMFSCQKEDMGEMSLKGAVSSEEPSPNCEDCVEKWGDSKATYVVRQSTDGTKYAKFDVHNNFGQIIVRLYGGSSLSGKSFNITINGTRYPTNGNISISSNFHIFDQVTISPWTACTQVIVNNIEINGLNDQNFGQVVSTGPFNYYMQELCTTTTLTASETEDICVGDEVIISAAVSTKEPVSGGGFLAVTDGVLKIYKDGVEVASGVNSAEYTYIAEFGDVVFTAEYTGAGGFADSDDEITVTAENCGCEESFCYVDNGDGSYTFTYVPAESFTEAYLEFTFPGTTVDAEAEGWSNPANGVPANVKQITIDLVECVPYVFTFKLTNINGPLWTDFKVNGTARNLGYDNELSCEIE